MAGSRGTRTGTQSLQRSLDLLKLIAARGHFGWRLRDLASASGMTEPTVHRLLGNLVAERMVARRPVDRHYLPGPLLYELALSVPFMAGFVGVAQASLDRIAMRTGVAAYLFLRSGSEYVCAATSGRSHLKGVTIEVGTRRPLIATTGGIAILIGLGAEAQTVVDKNIADLRRFGSERLRAVQRVLRESRRVGFAVHHGQIVPAVHALGLPVRDRSGAPVASVSVIGPAERLPATKTDEIIALLAGEVRLLEAGLAGYPR